MLISIPPSLPPQPQDGRILGSSSPLSLAPPSYNEEGTTPDILRWSRMKRLVDSAPVSFTLDLNSQDGRGSGDTPHSNLPRVLGLMMRCYTVPRWKAPYHVPLAPRSYSGRGHSLHISLYPTAILESIHLNHILTLRFAFHLWPNFSYAKRNLKVINKI